MWSAQVPSQPLTNFKLKSPSSPSYATIHTAKDAMKIVTSYAGPFMPERDNRLKRNVRETLDGTYTYVGSKSGIKGEIDTEEDITEAGTTKGWEDYPEEHRPATFDTDQDGMPDWWEQCVGSDPSTANQNDDPDGDGYTLLEDYLEFMAHPYVIIEPNGQASIELSQHFRGFYGQNGASVTPTYQLDVTKGGDHITATISGSLLNVKAQSSIEPCIGTINVTVNDGETTFTQPFGVAITGQATGIHQVSSQQQKASNGIYNLLGQRLTHPKRGVNIVNGKKFISK